jgi:hypothetical protein
VARLVRNLLPKIQTGFLYGSPKSGFAQTVPTKFQALLPLTNQRLTTAIRVHCRAQKNSEEITSKGENI